MINNLQQHIYTILQLLLRRVLWEKSNISAINNMTGQGSEPDTNRAHLMCLGYTYTPPRANVILSTPNIHDVA